MKELAYATIAELRTLLQNGDISPAEIYRYYHDRIAQHDEQIQSLLERFDMPSDIHTDEDSVLAGIPGIIKDNILIKDRTATAASKILHGFIAPYNATVIDRLKQAGTSFLGRANMDEFAMGSSGETSAYQFTKNPWDQSRVPGGSSGGSAAAVAAGFAPWALGTETGGSVRQPAAMCGIVGMKPTYGLVSRYGLIHYASSMDQIGVLTRTVADNARVLQTIAGHDIQDSTSLSVEQPDYVSSLPEQLSPGLRIGVVQNALYADGIDSEIQGALQEAIAVFEQLGATVHHINLSTLEYAAATYFIMSRAEAASNLARFDGVRYGMRSQDVIDLNSLYEKTRDQGFGTEIKSRILVGNYVLSASHVGDYYTNAQRVRHQIQQDFAAAFNDVDILLMPTQATPAFKFGAYAEDKLAIDLQDYFTCAANLAGIPAISVPCGMTRNNLPIGMQLLAPHLHEQLIYNVAHVYEQATEWHTLHPSL